MNDLDGKYADVLKCYLGNHHEETLLAAYDLGKNFRFNSVSPDQVIGLHIEAVERLALDLPEPLRSKTILASFKILLEVMIAFGVTHLEGVEQASRSRQRQETIAQLQDLDRMKDQFLGVLSHELRTPINAIMGFSSSLADEVMGPLSPNQLPYVHKILASSQVMLQLVNDLLDMSRVQAGKFSVDIGPMDFSGVTREVLANIEVLARVKNQVLVVEVPAGELMLQGDRLRVGQIITNLISNAIKFTPKGGTIILRARIERNLVLCEIEDTGIGITQVDLSTIFIKFTQLDMSNTRASGGAGLGLSICQTLVACHGGSLGVRSDLGQGSTFWFTLPLAGPPVDLPVETT